MHCCVVDCCARAVLIWRDGGRQRQACHVEVSACIGARHLSTDSCELWLLLLLPVFARAREASIAGWQRRSWLARIQPQRPPRGEFTLEDLQVHASEHCGGCLVAAVLVEDPGLPSAQEVVQRFTAGETRRAGCPLVCVDDVRPAPELRLSQSLLCSHRRCQHQRALRSGGALAADAAEASTGLPPARKRSRGAAEAQHTAEVSQPAGQGAGGDARACGFRILIRLYTYVLYFLLASPEHADETDEDAHPPTLSAECCNVVRDGHACGLQTESLVKGASDGTCQLVHPCMMSCRACMAS